MARHRYRRLALAFLAIALASPIVTKRAHAATQSLTILAEDAAEPFSGKDGTGFANDIVRAAFAAKGVTIAFDVVPYARCKKAVEDGRTPACFAMAWIDEFTDLVAFSDRPIYHVHADYFQRKASPLASSNEAAIAPGTRIGVVNGYEYPDGLYDLRKRGVILENGTNEESILLKLAAGRLDAALVITNDLEPLNKKLASAGVADKVTYLFRSAPLESFIGFSLHHPLGEWARRTFNEGFQAIDKDGTAQKIEQRWIERLSH